MLQTNVDARVRRTASTTHADSKHRGDNPFRRYKKEDAKAVRVPEVKENAAIAQLRDAWDTFGYDHIHSDPENVYQIALAAIEKIQYTKRDVEMFSIVLVQFQEESNFDIKAGLFLSALINNCSSDEFVIHTTHLDESLSYLGFQNTKNITIEGDVGRFLGCLMQGGEILVNGNAGYNAAAYMRKGKIIVKGNCDMGLGSSIMGGRIDIYGRIGSLGMKMRGGNIYHRGTLIVENGQILDPTIS